VVPEVEETEFDLGDEDDDDEDDDEEEDEKEATPA
jgi:hypothetical protein